MASVFVSHAAEDAYFVNLMISLLDFHDVENWCSQHNLPPGARFREEISVAISQAEAMIVVVSRNTVQSKWVTQEIATFQAKNPQGAVIPVLLDSTNPASIIDGLDQYEALDFSRCMCKGFEDLLAVFGRDFLRTMERRAAENRRKIKGDRRSPADRRESPMVQRLRKGCWLSYHEATERGKFDPVDIYTVELMELFNALLPEIERYVYRRKDGSKCPPSEALEQAIDVVGRLLRERKVSIKAVYITDAVGEVLCRLFQVETTSERREQSRRSTERRGGVATGLQ